MRAERMTVSTVGIGSGADMKLLSNIANWGGGREYFTQDPYNIPQIFAKETVTASKSAIIDEPFIPQVMKFTQVLQGLISNSHHFCSAIFRHNRGRPPKFFWSLIVVTRC